MNDKIKNFMEYVSSHEELKAELKSVTEGKSKEEQISNILAFAKKHDMELTKNDIAPECAELDEDELEAINGGGGCGCVIAGNGGGDGIHCFCVIFGGGHVEGSGNLSQGACVCPLGGAGATRRH